VKGRDEKRREEKRRRREREEKPRPKNFCPREIPREILPSKPKIGLLSTRRRLYFK
jgi:hypothetical protein